MKSQPPSFLNNETEKPTGKLKPLSRILPLLFSIILLGYFLSQFKGYDLFFRISLPYFALALLISLVLNAFFGAYKWRSVMRLSDIQLSYWETWKLWVGLYPITFVMPFHAGHLLHAIALKKMKDINYFEAIESVGYDKYLNVVATFCLIGIGWLVAKPLHAMARTWILVCALSVVAFYLVDFRVIRSYPF